MLSRNIYQIISRKEISETSKLYKSNNFRNVKKEFLPPTVNIEEIIRSPFVRGGFFWWQHSRSSCYPYSIFFMISPVSIIAEKTKLFINFISIYLQICRKILTVQRLLLIAIHHPHWYRTCKTERHLCTDLTLLGLVYLCKN